MVSITQYSAPLLRFGMAFVYAWFGINQLMDPAKWANVVPDWSILSGIDPAMLVTMNGTFEVIAAAMLLVGIFVRPVALLLAIHVAIIGFSFGTSPIAIRDYGLAIATLAIAVHGYDAWCVWRAKRVSNI